MDDLKAIRHKVFVYGPVVKDNLNGAGNWQLRTWMVPSASRYPVEEGMDRFHQLERNWLMQRSLVISESLTCQLLSQL